MFQCHSPKSSHPLPLPLSPKVRYIHNEYSETEIKEYKKQARLEWKDLKKKLRNNPELLLTLEEATAAAIQPRKGIIATSPARIPKI